MKPKSNVQVLVVGLGPVGAALSALLVQRGISVLAVDRENACYPLPRAVGFDHEIMRLFQQLGLAEEVGKHIRFTPCYDFVNAQNQLLLRYDRRNAAWPSAWPPNVTFFQPAVETGLRRLVASSKSGAIRLGRKLSSFIETPDGIEATLFGPNGDEHVRALYLIGCDGGTSTVRSLLNVAMDDYGFDEPWLVVDFKSDDETGLPDQNLQFCDPARPATFMRMGPGRHRWEFMLLEGDNPEELRSDTEIRRLVRERGITFEAPIERRAIYRFHALVAKQWRRSRTILAGDAAHMTPPFAGQGMCSGLRDAANLSWKLDAVLKGTGDSLLDSYQEEREPHVRYIIQSAIALGRVVCTTSPAIAAERDARMIAEQRAGKVPISMIYPPLQAGCLKVGAGAGELFPQPWVQVSSNVLRFDDILDLDPVLLTRTRAIQNSGFSNIRLLSLDDTELTPFRETLDTWLTDHKTDAVLIRPDRYVFGTGDANELASAWQAMTSHQQPINSANGGDFSART